MQPGSNDDVIRSFEEMAKQERLEREGRDYGRIEMRQAARDVAQLLGLDPTEVVNTLLGFMKDLPESRCEGREKFGERCFNGGVRPNPWLPKLCPRHTREFEDSVFTWISRTATLQQLAKVVTEVRYADAVATARPEFTALLEREFEVSHKDAIRNTIAEFWKD